MSGYPHATHRPSYWLSQPGNLANHRTTEELPKEADVVIIGSGYSGAAIAYHILKDPAERPSVVILEARETCSGATGRNGGHLKPDTYFNWALYENMYGGPAASDLMKFEAQQVYEVKQLVEQEQIDCDFELTRACDVYMNDEVAQNTVKAYRDMVRVGVADTKDVHCIEDPKKAEQVSGVKGAKAAFTFTAGHVWPYKMIIHLLRRCIEWGANLQTHTKAVAVDKSAAGGWNVSTLRGNISAKRVVVATNGYTSALVSAFEGKITPVRGLACRIAVPRGTTMAPHLNNSYSIRFGPKEYDYLIPRSDGSIVVGGAKQVVLKEQKYWYGNTNDSELIPGGEEYFNNYMQRTFHGWEQSDARTTDIWTGIMGYSNDLMPYVGEMPGSEGLYVTAAYTGHGMPRILGCAKAIASLLKNEKRDISETNVPWPYWVTEKRLNSKENVTRAYMVGEKAKL